MLIIKDLIGGLFQVVMFAALLLIPAGLVPGGTWTGERAIYFLIGYGIFVEILIDWPCIVASAGMDARFKKAPKDEKRHKEDKILAPLIAIFFVFRFWRRTIWLESWVGLIAILPFLVVMILRIRIEERYLVDTLSGYPDYMKKVKYILLPYIW